MGKAGWFGFLLLGLYLFSILPFCCLDHVKERKERKGRKGLEYNGFLLCLSPVYHFYVHVMFVYIALRGMYITVYLTMAATL